MKQFSKLKHGFALTAAALVVGCASVPYDNPDDPWERYNRSMFKINEGVDKAVMKPVAKGYNTVAPLPVKVGVGNFFGNLGDVWIGANNLMQGKGSAGASDLARVLINSTVGILGVFDVATEMGLEKHDEDFGQTLAVWGVPQGPYFVVPFFGPRTLRGAGALPLDLYASSAISLADVPARNAMTGVKLVDQRARLLGAERAVEQGSLDKYAYTRDFYLQRRRYEIYDGNPPRERFDDGASLNLQPGGLRVVEADEMAFNSLQFALVQPAR